MKIFLQRDIFYYKSKSIIFMNALCYIILESYNGTVGLPKKCCYIL
jgi:hypothetical protein